VLVALLVLGSVLAGRTMRERLLAPGVAVASVALVALIDLLVFRQTYFPVYGRYTLPLGVLVPLVAGHVITQRLADTTPLSPPSSARAPRLLAVAPRVALPLVALVQLIAVWTSARRAAVSVDGPAWFFGRSQFVPPGGWQPWFVLAVVGTLALASAGLDRPERNERPTTTEAFAEPELSVDRQPS
jgi:hypothetical protein